MSNEDKLAIFFSLTVRFAFILGTVSLMIDVYKTQNKAFFLKLMISYDYLGIGSGEAVSLFCYCDSFETKGCSWTLIRKMPQSK